MSFMRREIVKGSWLLIDGPRGIDCVPADLCSRAVLDSFGHTHAEWTVTPDSEGFDKLAALVSNYTENREDEINSIEMKRGFGARLSAPGYLDCTPWAVFATESEAEEYLAEMYSEDEDEDENADKDASDAT